MKRALGKMLADVAVAILVLAINLYGGGRFEVELDGEWWRVW